MSGPKCATPVYISNAERERRALAQARAAAEAAAARLAAAQAEAAQLEAARIEAARIEAIRHKAASADAAEVASRLGAARQAAPNIARGTLLPIPPDATADELLRYVREAEAAIEKIAARTRLYTALDGLDAANRAAGAGVRLETAAARTPAAPAARQQEDQRDARARKLGELLAELPGNTAALLEIGTKWVEERDPLRQERYRSELLNAAKTHERQFARRAEVAGEVDGLLAQLGGVEGPDAEELRRELRATADGGALDDVLRARVQALDAADKMAHVDDVVQRVLAQHHAQSDFLVAFDTPGRLIAIGIPDAYALAIDGPGEVRFEPVRGATCTATDAEIQRAYHDALGRIETDARRAGVELHTVRISLREPPVRAVALGDASERRAQAPAAKARKLGDNG